MKVRAKIRMSGIERIEEDVRYFCKENFPKEQLACVHGGRYVRELARASGIELGGARSRSKRKKGKKKSKR